MVANWPIRIGGEYLPIITTVSGWHVRVTAIDGENIHTVMLSKTPSRKVVEHHHDTYRSSIFRACFHPEDQSPVPELVEALKWMLFIYEDQERGYDYFLGKHVPTILKQARAALEAAR